MLAPHYYGASEYFKKLNRTDIILGRLDGEGENEEFISNFGISGFPTVLLFHSKQLGIKAQMPPHIRKKSQIIKWIKKECPKKSTGVKEEKEILYETVQTCINIFNIFNFFNG